MWSTSCDNLQKSLATVSRNNSQSTQLVLAPDTALPAVRPYTVNSVSPVLPMCSCLLYKCSRSVLKFREECGSSDGKFHLLLLFFTPPTCHATPGSPVNQSIKGYFLGLIFYILNKFLESEYPLFAVSFVAIQDPIAVSLVAMAMVVCGWLVVVFG